jgi:hypothetical protein
MGPFAGAVGAGGRAGPVNSEEHEVSRAIPRMPHAPAVPSRRHVRQRAASAVDRPPGRFHARSIGALPSPPDIHAPRPGSRSAVEPGRRKVHRRGLPLRLPAVPLSARTVEVRQVHCARDGWAWQAFWRMPAGSAGTAGQAGSPIVPDAPPAAFSASGSGFPRRRRSASGPAGSDTPAAARRRRSGRSASAAG